MPLLTPNHSFMTQVFYRQHALAYPQPQFYDSSILQTACPCLPPTTVLRHKYSTGSVPLLTPCHSFRTQVFYRQHALAYPQLSFYDKSILLAACPCLLPTTVLRHKYSTGSVPLLTPGHSFRTQVFYRQHALAYPLPQF